MALIEINGLSLGTKPRKDGRWQAIYRNNGNVSYAYGRTEFEMLKNAEILVKKPQTKKPKKSIKLWVYVDNWLEKYRKPNFAHNTYKSDYYTAHKYIKDTVFGNKSMNSITAVEVQDFLNAIESKRPRKDTWEILKLVFRHAKGTHVKVNPMDEVPKYEAKSKKGSPLSRVQQRVFIEYLTSKEPENEFLFMFYLGTGARRSEALSIKWEDINIEEKYLLISSQVDGDDNDIDTKTDASVRKMPILPSLLPYLIKYRKQNGRVFNKTPDWASRKAREIFDELKFPKRLTLHSLRHTTATRLYENGVKLEIIELWLGHVDISITKRYVEINEELEAKRDQFDINFDIKNDDKPEKL